MSYGTWLRDLRAEERDAGVDHRDLACYASKLTPHVRDHLALAAQGIEELYTSLPAMITPDWAQRTYWEDSREVYLTRLTQALQHLGSALVAAGCTDAELNGLISGDAAGKNEASASTVVLTLSEKPMDETSDDGEETVTASASSGDLQKASSP